MSANETTEANAEHNRRDFLYIATGMAGVVGVAGAVWPFIDQLRPDATTLAVAQIDVDLSEVQPGQSITAMWRGKPVFIRNRTEAEIDAARETPLSDLPDQLARVSRRRLTLGWRRPRELAGHDRRVHASGLRPLEPAG